MIRPSLIVALSAAILGTAVLSHAVGRPPAAGMGGPHYDAAGRLIFPADYRDWIFLSAGLDMNYSEAGATPQTHVFGNVFVPPAAYHRFQATGHWPDGTVLIVENRAGRTDGSINKSGQFQTGIVGVEAHVRDRVRFRGGWAFFAFTGRRPAERIGYSASCYSCHLANAAVDTTFVQFYPTLLPIAIARGSVSPPHRAEARSIARRSSAISAAMARLQQDLSSREAGRHVVRAYPAVDGQAARYMPAIVRDNRCNKVARRPEGRS